MFREKERDTERQLERERQRDRDRQTETDRQTDRMSHSQNATELGQNTAISCSVRSTGNFKVC